MQKAVRRLTFVDIGEWWRGEVETCEETCARVEGGCNERHSCAYATMCMFYMSHSWAILESKGFDFAWRLDDDGMIQSPLMVDIAAVMKSQGWVYGMRHVRRSNHGIMSDGQVRPTTTDSNLVGNPRKLTFKCHVSFIFIQTFACLDSFYPSAVRPIILARSPNRRRTESIAPESHLNRRARS